MKSTALRCSTVRSCLAAAVLFACGGASAGEVDAGEAMPLRVGWAKVDITPEGPVAMRGGVVSQGVMDPLSATALAFDGGMPGHRVGVVLVACDLLFIQDGGRSDTDLVAAVRARVAASDAPGIEAERVVLSATHTHVAPTVREGSEYFDFLADRLAEAAVAAWRDRAEGAVSYGLGHAVAAHHRIASYRDGSSRMAGSFQGGKVSDPDFTHLEGFEDHSVHLLYTWDAEGRLSGVVTNIACPAQVQRGDLLSADYWHEAREELARRLGPEVHLLPQLSAAGDLANLVMVERAGEARMQRLMFPGEDDPRKLRRLQIASRVVDAIEAVLPYMAEVAESRPLLAHQRIELALPRGFPEPDPEAPPLPAEVHALRIGEVAMVTNPFELYLDYGVRIKGRSPATQTFVLQLAGGGSYLPTRRAVAGGGYGAIASTCVVGPEAGDRLVEASLELLEALWAEPAAP